MVKQKNGKKCKKKMNELKLKNSSRLHHSIHANCKRFIKFSLLNIEEHPNTYTNIHSHTHAKRTTQPKQQPNPHYKFKTEHYKLGKWLFIRIQFNVFVF